MLLLLLGCVKTVMFVNGMHAPRPMSDKKLERFATKWNIDRSRSYTLNNAGFHLLLESEHGYTVPDLWVFDSQGRSVHYGAPEDCKQETFSWLEQLAPDQEHTYDSITLEDLTRHFRSTNGDTPASLPDPGDADYTLIMHWAHFGGKLNNYAEDWKAQAAKNSAVKFQLYYLNVDPQPDWSN